MTEKICQFCNTESSQWVDVRYFYYQHTKYIWDSVNLNFSTIDDLTPPKTVDEHLNNSDGLKHEEYLNK